MSARREVACLGGALGAPAGSRPSRRSASWSPRFSSSPRRSAAANGDADVLAELDSTSAAQCSPASCRRSASSARCTALLPLPGRPARSDRMRGQFIGVVVAARSSRRARRSSAESPPCSRPRTSPSRSVPSAGQGKTQELDERQRPTKWPEDTIGRSARAPARRRLRDSPAARLRLRPRLLLPARDADRPADPLLGIPGIALGAVPFGFFQFALLWFVYLGLLLLGRRPRRPPPAWAAGEAIPWPTPGEKAAAAALTPGGSGPEESERSRPSRARAAKFLGVGDALFRGVERGRPAKKRKQRCRPTQPSGLSPGGALGGARGADPLPVGADLAEDPLQARLVRGVDVAHRRGDRRGARRRSARASPGRPRGRWDGPRGRSAARSGASPRGR